MGALRQYLVEHPELVWLCGFPLVASRDFPWGFDVEASLPTQRHFTRMLRKLPNPALQFLLDSSVTSLQGDPDCRLGCKRRCNQRASSKEPPSTPPDNPVPANTISVGEYYWGYASGVVATKVPDWGEFVLAELTQSFDRPDVSYFFPLMADVERRLGFRPKFGALDAAFDAWCARSRVL